SSSFYHAANAEFHLELLGVESSVRGQQQVVVPALHAQSDVEHRVVALLRSHPAVEGVELVGSRAEGRANERSDWDFRVVTDAFERLAPALPELLAPLEPITQQWDRLSEHPCWMQMLRGPVKIDLIFAEEVQEPGPPWTS